MKSKNLQDALEIARQHVLDTNDIPSDTIEKYWEQFGFDNSILTFLAKKGFHEILTSELRSPGRPQVTRSYEVTSRSASPIEQAMSGNATSTFKHRPIITVKPSKFLTNVADQILDNVALEGANGRRILLRNFSVMDCNHYDKTQSFIVEGIQRKRQVISNIRARLKFYGVSKVAELPAREQTFTAREWKNAEKGVEPPAFAAAVGQ